MTAETSQSVALLKNSPSEKKEITETPAENVVALKHMRKYVSQEIERRRGKEKLKKHLDPNYHQYKAL